MDRNSIIGIVLIAAVLGYWVYTTTPSKEQIARQKYIKDSVEYAEKVKKANTTQNTANTQVDSIKENKIILSDSAIQLQNKSYYKDFFVATTGTEKLITLENEKVKITFSNKGAKVKQVELKEYKRYGKTENLKLFSEDSTSYALVIDAYEKTKVFYTDSFYFEVLQQDKNNIVFRLNTSIPTQYIDFEYTLNPNDYTLNFDVEFSNMNKIVSSNTDQVFLKWKALLPSQEKHINKEKDVATVYFKYNEDSPDYINPKKDEEKAINEMPVKWVCFKQQFFNATIIADNSFLKDGSIIRLRQKDNDTTIVKATEAELGIPYNHQASEKFGMRFYFGPNHYQTLKKYDGLDLHHIIPTGWWIFKYINTGLVIPLVNWLKGIVNFGIILILLNLIVKIILFPIFYKNYLSGAKMKALKPEINKITEKYSNNADPVKKQQETYALYQRAKVNPMMGCLLLVIQFPVLIALFNFVPAAIELRQEHFLWSDDLSTYDSIWNFGKVSFIYSIYGDHVSLFALLMFVSTIIYTWINSEMLSPQQEQQMPGMKWMMYFMPVIFLAVMNSYSAGLSWYYFTANILTFAQTLLLKKFVSEHKLRAQIEENLKKPVKVSGFQKRLQDMVKQQQNTPQKKKK